MNSVVGMSDSIRNVPLSVVDASVAVKWVLRDEPDSRLADLVLADFRDGGLWLVAPAHLRYEIPSAVRNAVRARRLSAAPGRVAIDDFLSWRIPAVDDDGLIAHGYDLSLRFGCSLFDGVYLALAESLDCPFVFADRRLHNALGTDFPLAVWLEDYVGRS